MADRISIGSDIGVTARARISNNLPGTIRMDLTTNARYDGAQWLRDDVSKAAAGIVIQEGSMQVYVVAAGANPIVWTPMFAVATTGVTATSLAATGAITAATVETTGSVTSGLAIVAKAQNPGALVGGQLTLNDSDNTGSWDIDNFSDVLRFIRAGVALASMTGAGALSVTGASAPSLSTEVAAAPTSRILLGHTDAVVGAWIRNDGNHCVLSTNTGDLYLGFAGNLSKTIRIGNATGAVQVAGNATDGSLVVNTNGTVSMPSGFAPRAWTPLNTHQNTWVNGSSDTPLEYVYTEYNTIRIRGSIINGTITAGAPFFTLPGGASFTGWSAGKWMVFTQGLGNATPFQMTVYKSGIFQCDSAVSTAWLLINMEIPLN